MIRRTSGVAVDERGEVVADRRQAAAAVDQDRDVALDGEREDGVEPLVADRELLRARMELDPAGAEVEARGSASSSGPLVEIEPHERDDPARRSPPRRRACGRWRRVNAGTRSGSSRQNVNAPAMPTRSNIAEQLVRAGPASRRCRRRGGCARRRGPRPAGSSRERALADLVEDALRALERLHGAGSARAPSCRRR